MHGRVQHGVKPGVKTALTPEEEEKLAAYIKDMQAAGFELRGPDVRDRAAEILRVSTCPSSPNRDWSPGHNWFAGFRKRHPDITMKRAFNRLSSPSLAKQKQVVKQFYESLAHAYKKAKVISKPDRIFAVSETLITVFQRATVLVCSSASGNVMHPFVVLNGNRLKLTSAQHAYPEAHFACNSVAKVNDEIFFQWFRDHFVKNVARGKHCVLVMSYSPSYISVKLHKLAKEHKVTLVNIHETISDVVQPISETICDNLENVLTKKAAKWELENQGTPFTQKVLAQLLRKAWKKGISPEDITENFSKAGLYPLNSFAVTADKLLKRSTEKHVPIKSESSSAVNLSGLSLLSALSSHEYASMEHLNWNSRTSGGVLPSASFPPADNEDMALDLQEVQGMTSTAGEENDDDDDDDDDADDGDDHYMEVLMETDTKTARILKHSRKQNTRTERYIRKELQPKYPERDQIIIDSSGNIIQGHSENNSDQVLQESGENLIETEVVDHQECFVIKEDDLKPEEGADAVDTKDSVTMETKVSQEDGYIVIKNDDNTCHIVQDTVIETEVIGQDEDFVIIKHDHGDDDNVEGQVVEQNSEIETKYEIQTVEHVEENVDGSAIYQQPQETQQNYEILEPPKEEIEPETQTMEIQVVESVTLKEQDLLNGQFEVSGESLESMQAQYTNENATEDFAQQVAVQSMPGAEPGENVVYFENVVMVPITEQTVTIE